MWAPLNQGEVELAVAGTVTFTGGFRVRVEPETGYIAAN
jgi:hypothetical protein